MVDDIDVISCITPFLSDQYINVAVLNTTWYNAYVDLPRETKGFTADISVEQFVYYLGLGYGYVNPTKLCTRPCEIAASAGRIDLLKAAYKSGHSIMDAYACVGAARGGQLDCLKYLRLEGCPWNYITCHEAAYGSHFEVLKWAIRNGCPSNNGTMVYAAGSKNLEMVKWLHENGHIISACVCTASVYAGATDIIEWARSKGKTWTKTFSDAIDASNLSVLKHLHEIGAPWESGTVFYSARRDSVSQEVVEWLYDKNYI